METAEVAQTEPLVYQFYYSFAHVGLLKKMCCCLLAIFWLSLDYQNV